MPIVIVTGSAGLIGSETVKFFHEKGYDVYGIDNNLREYFFGKEASTQWNVTQLTKNYKRYHHHNFDIRDQGAVYSLFKSLGPNIEAVIHTAAQPSHDWAAKEPLVDFGVNAQATLLLLEATRLFCPTATFIFTSTNKVYGDRPNEFPLVEKATRWEMDPASPYAKFGFDENLSVDQSKHSLFGASKLAADVLVQEYGRYFGLKTGIFRGGCLTGPAHSGAELHGFLAYLVQCAVTGKKYTIFGYKGKQVRDNIHSHDLVSAFWCFHSRPKAGAVYNLGGSRHSNCSVLEAISKIESLTNRKLEFTISDQNRIGDHIWWISDVRRFQKDFPDWKYEYTLDRILAEIVDESKRRAKGTVPKAAA